MKSVCVFCGSQHGNRSEYVTAARELAEELVRRDLRLVYGGGNVGLMGVLADQVLAGGGEVIGVIPRALVDRELAHREITQLHVVETMHERKAMMAVLSDAFLTIPGGFGTLEEMFEVITWKQLRFHAKPCGLLNIDGYFDPLLAFLDRSVTDGFVRPQHRQDLLVSGASGDLLQQLAAAATSVESVPRLDIARS